MSGGEQLLTPALLAQLERLRLPARDLPSARVGGRKTRQLGSSLEFAEYRAYTPGDDLRYIDWRAYARLGKLFLKRYLDERDALLYLLVDTSRSMDFDGKWLQAKRIAAALGYLTLAGGDRAEAWLFAAGVGERTPRLAGKQSAYRLFELLGRTETGEEGSLDWLAGGSVPREPGVVVVLSDFLFETGYEESLRRLQARGHQVVVLQILARVEIDPPYAGDSHLIDSESGFARDVSISPHVLKRYKQAALDYTARLADFCRRRGMAYALIVDDEKIEDVLFRRLLSSGVMTR